MHGIVNKKKISIGGKGGVVLRFVEKSKNRERRKGARTSNGRALTTTERPARNRHFRFTQISSFANKLVLCCSEVNEAESRL